MIKMKSSKQYDLLKILWIVTGLIILILSAFLIVLGEGIDRTIGIIGLVLVAIEYVLYKKGIILNK